MSTPIINPTALADQLHAASADAARYLRQAADNGRGTLGTATGEWLAHHATILRQALTDHTARVCPHLPGAPRVVHAAVWAPGILVCPTCVWHLIPNPDEDTTCDRCRHTANPIHAGILALGPVLLGYGLCDRCKTTIHAPARPVRRPRRRS